LSTPSPSPASGFTLLEIIIALAIVALVFTGLFSVFSTALSIADDVKRAENLDQAARAIFLQINNDLRSLYLGYSDTKTATKPDLKQEEQEEQQESNSTFLAREFIPEKDKEQVLLEFYSASSLDFDQQYPRLRANRVAYALRKNKKENTSTNFELDPLYSLLRKEIPFAGEKLGKEEKIFELASNVASCKFSYLDQEREKSLSWQSSKNENTLPVMLKVELVLQGEQGQERTYHLNIDLSAKDEHEKD
jgi:type II secretion system protein J